jgi:hypothetical protein
MARATGSLVVALCALYAAAGCGSSPVQGVPGVRPVGPDAFAGDEQGFCAAYGSNAYAPDLR